MIDFLVIGAQKTGTTSLFEYMRQHPQVYMPPEKEVSFFDRRFSRGPDWYFRTVLRDAPVDATIGEASVGYMGGAPFGEMQVQAASNETVTVRYDSPLEQVIPERIQDLLPHARLVCTLREPVARAYSHYRMAVLRGEEEGSFDDVVRKLLCPDELERSRHLLSETNSYIVYGEYGRILKGFTAVFPRRQLLVIFSEDLVQRPAHTLATIFRFIGVTDDVVPDNLNERYRTAAIEPRIRYLNLYRWQQSIARLDAARTLWHKTPAAIRERIDAAYNVAGFRVSVWNARRGQEPEQITEATRQLLIKHYKADSEELCETLGLEVPWLSKWQLGSSVVTS